MTEAEHWDEFLEQYSIVRARYLAMQRLTMKLLNDYCDVDDKVWEEFDKIRSMTDGTSSSDSELGDPQRA